MSIIKSLELPLIFPTENAIKSFNQNIHSYEPDFWEFQYEVNRYLRKMSDDELIQRYKEIVFNSYFYAETRRSVIPINSFLSSWFWFRKEHQTRYEFYLRKKDYNFDLSSPMHEYQSLYKTRGPNACDKLFRYGEYKYLKEFIDNGKFRISPASSYKDGTLTDSRSDNELVKHKQIPWEKITLIKEDGRRISISGDVTSSVSAPDYYTLCLATEFDEHFFKEFPYDSCLVIHDAAEFEKRIKEITDNLLPKWYFLGTPIEYYDPYENASKNPMFMATLYKTLNYAFQREYRLILDPLEKEEKINHMFITIGNLNDICELFRKK